MENSDNNSLHMYINFSHIDKDYPSYIKQGVNDPKGFISTQNTDYLLLNNNIFINEAEHNSYKETSKKCNSPILLNKKRKESSNLYK